MSRIWSACALVIAGCAFDARYDSGRYTCHDGTCPPGLVCSPAQVCVAGGDAGGDATIDVPPAALTCDDPGLLPVRGGTLTGTTTGRTNTVSAVCSGFVTNGSDAVYRIDTAAGDKVTISVAATFSVGAYMIAPCTNAPATPRCAGDLLAANSAPTTVTATFVGPHYIVVDSVIPTQSGHYTLTVTNAH